jgi:molybdate transport system substrate-binding protein
MTPRPFSGIRIAALWLTVVLLGTAGLLSSSDAADLRIAVAANFAEPAEALAAAFETKSGIAVSVSSGSSGALFAQIAQGAPFAVFLSADSGRPAELEAQGHAVGGSRFTYALGTLVLWSADTTLIDGTSNVLGTDRFSHLAIANPETAPYGAAALEVLAALGLTETVRERIVTGQSVAQTFQFVQSGNAELGFVALSQLVNEGGGSQWQVPSDLHQPIRQDAVLLTDAAENPVALAFMAFLKGPEAREIIAQFGYGLPED